MILQDTTTLQPPASVDEAAEAAGRFISGLTGSAVGADFIANLVLSFFVVVLVLLGRRVLLKVVDQRLEDPRARYRWSKTSSYVSFVLLLLVFLQIWFEAVRSVGTFLGLLSAGIAIALRDPVVDFAGWIFIIVRRPFDHGDRIQVGDHAGDVVDIRPFQFTLLEIGNWVDADQSTGRIIHVPNQKVFTDAIANYTAQFEYIWNEISVLVTFESDWRKAKEILTRIGDEKGGGVADQAQAAMKRSARKVLIHYQNLSPIVYLSVKESGVRLTLRHLCHPRSRRGITQAIWEALLTELAAHPDIHLAYPTQRIYYEPAEGEGGPRRSAPPPRDATGQDARGDLAGRGPGPSDAAAGPEPPAPT